MHPRVKRWLENNKRATQTKPLITAFKFPSLKLSWKSTSWLCNRFSTLTGLLPFCRERGKVIWVRQQRRKGPTRRRRRHTKLSRTNKVSRWKSLSRDSRSLSHLSGQFWEENSTQDLPHTITVLTNIASDKQQETDKRKVRRQNRQESFLWPKLKISFPIRVRLPLGCCCCCCCKKGVSQTSWEFVFLLKLNTLRDYLLILDFFAIVTNVVLPSLESTDKLSVK